MTPDPGDGSLVEAWHHVRGLRIFSRVPRDPRHGAGLPPIVLVHGLAVSGRYMMPTADRLAHRYAVYVPDLPGYGRSDKPRRPVSIRGLADDLHDWMAECGIGRPVLVGNSYGCQVIVDLAQRRPESVRGLVLAGPTVDDSHRSVAAELWRLLLDVPRERPSIIRLNLRDYLRTGLRRALETLRAAIADRIEEKMPSLHLPTLVVRGERDPLASQMWTEKLARLAPHGEHMVMAGAPHALNYSAAPEFARLVESFADRVATL